MDKINKIDRMNKGALAALLLAVCLLLRDRPAAQADPDVNALGGGWTTYAHGNTVWALARDGDALWAATYAGGAVRWDMSTLPPSSPASYPSYPSYPSYSQDEKTHTGSSPAYTQYLAPQTPLAGNDVRKVVVDAAGNKWFATQRGLSRLTPGGQWTTYTVENTDGGLPSNHLTALAVDAVGRIWVGAAQDRRLAQAGECDGPATPDGGPNLNCDGSVFFGGGVARFDGATWTTWRAPARPLHASADEVVSPNITDLAVDPASGEVWATAWPGWRWVAPDRVTHGPTAQGRWALDGAGGISRFDPVTKRWTHYQHDSDRDPPGRPAWPKVNAVTAVAIEPSGRKWFGVYGRGLQTLLGDAWTEFPATGNALLDDLMLALAVDGQGHIWMAPASVASIGRGVVELDTRGTLADPRDDIWRGYLSELSGSTVRAILPDEDGVWLGYTDRRGNGAGIDRLRRGHVVAHLLTEGPPSNNITALAVGRGEVWVGTGRRDGVLYGAGVGVLQSDGDWRTYAPGYTAGVMLGALTGDVAAGAGEVRLARPAADCLSLAVPYGVLVGDDPQPYPVAFSYVQDGQCALALDTPLRRAASASTPVYVAQLTLAGSNIGGMAFDPTGQVWIAAQGERTDLRTGRLADGGLSRFDGGRWTAYRQPTSGGNGPPSNAVSAVLPRNADCVGYPDVWVGTGSATLQTGQGVTVLDPATETWTRLDRAGLTSPNVSVLAQDPLGCDTWAATLPYRDGEGNFNIGGLSRWSAGERRWVAYDTANTPHLTAFQDAFSALLVDRRGQMWAGAATFHSVTFDPGSTTPCWVCAPDWVRLQGHADAALNLFSGGAWQDAPRWEYQGQVAALVEDVYGRVWVGLSRGWLTDDVAQPDVAYGRDLVGGGVRVRGAKWIAVDPLNSAMPDGNISALAAASDGSVWLGTVNHGVLRWQPNANPLPTATPPPTRVPAPTATPRVTPTPTATLPSPPQRLYLPYLSRAGE